MPALTANPLTARPLTAVPITARALGAGDSVWSPLALSPTVWYDPSDLSTLFQDSAGTVPVTVPGQPVGRMLDKSGNDYHMTQATSDRRPLYQSSGGLHWLQFDGVDDGMSFSAPLSAVDKNTVFIGAAWTNQTKRQFTLAHNGTGINSFGIESPQGNLTTTQGSCIGAVANDRRAFATTSWPYNGTANVVTVQNQISNVGTSFGRLNAVAIGGGVTSTLIGSAKWTNQPTYIGCRSFADLPCELRLYPLIFLTREATGAEIANAEEWVAAKSGVTL